MKDRFRFRVWVKTVNSYISEKDEADIVRLEEDGKIFVGLYDGDIEDMIYLKEQNLIIEQCTGLKDKNGKLIYEGDILDFAFRKYADYEDFYIGKVFFYNASFNVITTKDNQELPVGWLAQEDVEIVGNIHESPELLEEQNNGKN